MNEPINIVCQKTDTGYSVHSPEIPGYVETGKTLKEALSSMLGVLDRALAEKPSSNSAWRWIPRSEEPVTVEATEVDRQEWKPTAEGEGLE